MRDTVGPAGEHIENAVAIARAAIGARRFDVAREALTSFATDAPQARVCALMAQIEDAADDKGRVKDWLARAIHAPRDPMWVSDGVANTRWVPVSPVTGEIVPCEWKVPFEAPQGQLRFAADAPAAVATVAAIEAKPSSSPEPLVPPRADDPGVMDRDDA